MARALLMLSATSMIAYAATFVLGTLKGLGVIELRHFLLAIPVTMLVVFTHAMTLFFLIGCGTRIKDVLKETGIVGDYRAHVRALHNRFTPPAMYAILATMTTFILGGGADTETLDPLVHGGVALGGLILNGWATFVEFETVTDCVTLMDRLGHEVDQLELQGAARSAT
jgi:hypothetical protein